jgi:hypothetical protein
MIRVGGFGVQVVVVEDVVVIESSVVVGLELVFEEDAEVEVVR